jgi:hypothetical protein
LSDSGDDLGINRPPLEFVVLLDSIVVRVG